MLRLQVRHREACPDRFDCRARSLDRHATGEWAGHVSARRQNDALVSTLSCTRSMCLWGFVGGLGQVSSPNISLFTCCSVGSRGRRVNVQQERGNDSHSSWDTVPGVAIKREVSKQRVGDGDGVDEFTPIVLVFGAVRRVLCVRTQRESRSDRCLARTAARAIDVEPWARAVTRLHLAVRAPCEATASTRFVHPTRPLGAGRLEERRPRPRA